MHKKSLLAIPGIGNKYATVIQEWQRGAKFSQGVEYVGPMVVSDAKRILELLKEIAALDEEIQALKREREDWRHRSGAYPGWDRC